MAIEWQVLGRPGADNALLATVDTGQARAHLLFDCGEGCADALRPSTMQSLEHVCLSHFHMDHVAGFDSFFRHLYNRPDAPVRVWGPPETIETMGHRFRAFTWNLHENQPGEWIVHAIGSDQVDAARFHTAEAFDPPHPLPSAPHSSPVIFESPMFQLEGRLLPHHTIRSVGYRVREGDRRNVDSHALRTAGLAPGPWLQSLTDDSLRDTDSIEMDGRHVALGTLRRELLATTPGESLAYLTDFRLQPGTDEWEGATQWLAETDTIVCECQYHSRDEALARRHGHMTADLVGRLAAEAGAGSLVLVHLSRRYDRDDWMAMRDEVREAFPEASFPADWDLIPTGGIGW